MKLDLSGIDLDQLNQQPGQQERLQELQDLCQENMKMEPQQPQPQEQQYFAQQDQMSLEGRIGGNMNQQVQYGGIEIPYAVKQEGLGTSPVNMGYASPPAATSGTQHKMTVRVPPPIRCIF